MAKGLFKKRSEDEKDTEQCVLCHKVTDYSLKFPIQNRMFYIEGCGQLCESCYYRVQRERYSVHEVQSAINLDTTHYAEGKRISAGVPVDQEYTSEYEYCVICHGDTGYTFDVPICYRKFYVEGCGQLCEDCHSKLFHMKNNGSR